jgi:DNA-binding CsgD family transcriptional regulator
VIPSEANVIDLVADHLRTQKAGDWNRPPALTAVEMNGAALVSTKCTTAAGRQARRPGTSRPLIRDPRTSRAERLLADLHLLNPRWRVAVELFASGYTRKDIARRLRIDQRNASALLAAAMAAARMHLLTR